MRRQFFRGPCVEMPRSKKQKKVSTRTKKQNKMSVVVNVRDQALAMLEAKGLRAIDVLHSLCTTANGERTRGTKTMGKFKFVGERNSLGRGVYGPSMYLYVYPKDGSERDKMMVVSDSD